MQKKYFVIMAGMLGLLLSGTARSATVFFDDFEDGNHDGWLRTTVAGSGGSGQTGVESNNGSQMAFVKHQGKGQDSLSMDFGYLADATLSFDMQAVATLGYRYNGSALHSSSGVTISFLNFLNVPLGSITLINATSSGLVGADDIAIDSAQHNYAAMMGDFATVAGLDNSDPIDKISLAFFATADYSWGGNIYPNGRSSASVWFDNVTVSTVPVPAAVWLFGSGLLGLAARLRRKA